MNCTYCDGVMEPRTSKYGPFLSCSNYPACDARVGCHRDGTPKGTPARALRRKWRRAAHEVFDFLWRKPDGVMTRGEAYAWLERTAGVKHIADCDIHGCQMVITACYVFMSESDA